MPATSTAQQRLMGMVHAYQKGELKGASAAVRRVAARIDPEDALDFAKTKHRRADGSKLPHYVKKKKTFREFLEQKGWFDGTQLS